MNTKNMAMAVVIALGCVTGGCDRGKSSGPTYPLASSSAAPAAKGRVDVSVGPNGNTQVDIKVQHLAAPSAIAREATTYVAWIVPSGEQPAAEQPAVNTTAGAAEGQAGEQQGAPGAINAGAIQVQADLTGTLSTVTPYRRFQVVITPEASPLAAAPTNEPVLTAMVQAR